MISVKAGDEVQADVFMQHTKTVEISGRVIGRGVPASSAWVSLKLLGDDYGIDRNASTDDKGRFELKGIPPGSYKISAFLKNESDGGYEIRGQQTVEVSGSNIDSIVISVAGGTSLQGRITVDGTISPRLEGISITLSNVDEDMQFGIGARAKKDGTFEIKSVSDGNYAVTVWGLESNWFVKSVRIGGDDVLEKGLQLERGSAGRTIEVVISTASAQLDGSVSEGDTPLAGAHVRVAPDPADSLQQVPGAQLDDRPERAFLVYRSGSWHISGECEVWRVNGQRGSQIGTTDRHVVGT